MSEEMPRTPLMLAALGLNELFQTLLFAGFSETQALRLVGHMLTDLLTTDETD